MQAPLLEVQDLTVRLSGNTVLQNISFSIRAGECLAVQGPTGSGKTTLAKALTGTILHTGHVRFAETGGRKPRIMLISRQHRFHNLSNLNSFYYQQRYNAFDAEDALTVREELGAIGASEDAIGDALETLGIRSLLDEKLIKLSNGEHKRFQLAKAILQEAEWLLLDNPYVGLDAGARSSLNDILDGLVRSGRQVLLFAGAGELPSSVDRVLMLKEGSIVAELDRAAFERQRDAAHRGSAPLPVVAEAEEIPAAHVHPDFRFAVRMRDVRVTYGDRRILDGIDWEVRKGECWSLSGPNGSGKSTLLSLITGDNPQAFAHDIWLFDRKKGSGESIWDIKRSIGHVSPELHHYFGVDTDCLSVVASGLFDTIGLFRPLDALQKGITEKWMVRMGVAHLSRRQFRTLSDGEQRQVLLTRALVKDPPMLVLDEPCQGLDEDAAHRFNAMVNDITVKAGKTLIYVSHFESDIPECVSGRLLLGRDGRATVFPP
jgi:molybdate transport system ATP-binding protein